MKELNDVLCRRNLRIRQVFGQYPFIRLVMLFGSLAKGSARPESDIDLAVVSDQPFGIDEKMALISDLAQKFGRPVDLVDLSTAGEPLLGQILASGIMILGDHSRYAHLLTRHLFNQADFMPYRSRILRERRQAWIGL